MATTTPTLMQRTAAKWEHYKPRLWALAIGLIAGPIITNMAGWQVLSSTSASRVSDGMVQQQAAFCDARARVEVPEPGKLDWSARNTLAERFAVMPGTTKPASDVVSACSRKLSG